jgi:hypothetical protein
MPALKGTFLGKFTFQDSSAAMISIDFEQGELTRLRSDSGVIWGRVSLNAKMTVNFLGSPAQPPVIYVADPSSSFLTGEGLRATFSPDGNAGLHLIGQYSDATGQKLQVFIMNLRPPDSSALNSIDIRLNGAGTLTRE